MLDDSTHYRSLVGALQFLTITRPDLSFTVNLVSQYLQAPTIDHFQAVKHILCYVKSTSAYDLSFSRGSQFLLVDYSDVNWARYVETRRSTYGYAINLGENPLSWSAKKQLTVSRSSCESEYHALANVALEIVCVIQLLRELHVKLPTWPLLYSNNSSTIFLSQNPSAHKRAKYIDIANHFVCDNANLTHNLCPLIYKLQTSSQRLFLRSLLKFFRGKLRVGPHPHVLL